MQRIRTILRTVFLAIAVVATAGCGGQSAEDLVRYVGDTLVVGGVAYQRRPDGETHPDFYAKGRLYVNLWISPIPEPWSKLAKLGLTTDWDPLNFSAPEFTVDVPVGWEEQWVRAFPDLFGAIHVNRICMLIGPAVMSQTADGDEVSRSPCGD